VSCPRDNANPSPLRALLQHPRRPRPALRQHLRPLHPGEEVHRGHSARGRPPRHARHAPPLPLPEPPALRARHHQPARQPRRAVQPEPRRRRLRELLREYS
jgi:hypothetical protein